MPTSASSYGGRKMAPGHFAMQPRSDIPRSAFDVVNTHKTTLNAGFLVPVYVDEVLPGDSHSLRGTLFGRLATPVVPVMDNLYLDSFFFFVPNRLVWSNWERFMGEQASPTDSTQFLVPQMPCSVANGQLVPGGLGDYFGITANQTANTVNVNALPFRGYNRIWNEWFRDQDVDTPVTEDLGDGPDTPGNYVQLRRRKRPDYFTSARPWPEKPMSSQGQLTPLPGVLAQTTRVFGGTGSGTTPGQGFQHVQPGTGVNQQPYWGVGVPVVGIGVDTANGPSANITARNMPGGRQAVWANEYISNTESIFIKGSDVANSPDVRILINDLRLGVAVQGMLERNARGGTRYAELIRAHFGVMPQDARLQRPEYLGGGRSHMTVHPVAQTSSNASGPPVQRLGQLGGMLTMAGGGHGFSQSFTEHGFIIGLVCVTADLMYQEGVHRMWFRRSPYDHYFPGLAHLGEQAILSKEQFCDGSAGDLDVFGYQERWAEYKYAPSRTSGFMRSSNPTPLDVWHLGIRYNARMTVSSTFLEENPPLSRVMQVAEFNATAIILDSLFQVRKVRAMPMYSIPGVGARL